MAAIRRTYVLLTSAFALQAAAWAAAFLLRGLLDPGSDLEATSVAFQVAVLVVTIPLFALHWRWALRLGGGDRAESASDARRFYLYAMAALFALPLFINGRVLVRALLVPLAGGTLTDLTSDVVRALTALAVFGAAAWFIKRQLDSDRSASGEPGRAPAFRRLFTLGLSAVGLSVAASSVVALNHFVLQGFATTDIGIPFGPRQVSDVAAGALVGGALWFALWQTAERRFRTGDPDETQSALRKLYLYAIVLVAVLCAVFYTALLLVGFLRNLLGLDPMGDWRMPVAVIVVAAVLWTYHRIVLDRDGAAASEAPAQAALRRLYNYLVSIVGLFAALAGLVGVVEVLLRVTIGAAPIGNAEREVLAWSIAGLAAGLPVWLLPWRRAQAEAVATTEDAEAARNALPRKAYLYFTLLVATVTLVGSAIYIIFRLVSAALGASDPASNFGMDMARAIALAAIAAAAWSYHFRALRADGDLDEGARRSRMAALTVVVADDGDGDLGAMVIAALTGEASNIILRPAGLGAVASERLRGAATAAGYRLPEKAFEPAAAIDGADIIIAPWRTLTPGHPADAEFATAVARSEARRLVLPTPDDRWAWIGVERRTQETMAAEVVRAVEQVAAGEDVSPSHRWGAAELVLIGFGLLILIGIVGIPLAALLANLS